MAIAIAVCGVCGRLGSVIGHVERTRPLRDYRMGLMLPGNAASADGGATAPARTAAQHQSLLHFVADAAWSDDDVLAKAREMALPAIEKSGPVEAWIIDGTSFPKQGKHSVGAHDEYCGQLGKQANSQVAALLSVANHAVSLPVAYRRTCRKPGRTMLRRRKKAGCRADQVEDQAANRAGANPWACESGPPRGDALMDAAYGRDARLRAGMMEWARRTWSASRRPP